MASEFEVRFAFSVTQAQSVRSSGRPDAVLSFDNEVDARSAAAAPPRGAKMVMVRQLAPERRFICRKQVAA